jgi:hypothetical protein
VAVLHVEGVPGGAAAAGDQDPVPGFVDLDLDGVGPKAAPVSCSSTEPKSPAPASSTPYRAASASTPSESAGDTGSPVSEDYRPPYTYTGKIKQVDIHLAEAGVSTDEALLRAKFTAGKDY